MPIDGISVTQEDGLVVCCVEQFSDELKGLIRDELNRICYGKIQVDEDDEGHYSYKKTLAEFWDRYSGQSENTQKGMIGELLAHLVINKALPNLETISVFLNKEDQSIRKGFDLNYVDLEKKIVWYGEVKSGELSHPTTPDEKNRDLINLAKGGVREFLNGERSNLWDNVLVDAALSFASKEKRTVSSILKNDIREIKTDEANAKKNVILVPVLFHDSKKKITLESVRSHLGRIQEEDHFLGVILFCIQKSTFSKIAEFIEAESQA